MDDLDTKIKAFEAADFNTADAILTALRPIMDGYYVIGAIVPPPFMIYRARRSVVRPSWNSVSDLSYPKGGSHSDQRASRRGVEIFYGASTYDLAVAESQADWNDYVVLTEWKTTAPLLIQVVGMDDISDRSKPTSEGNLKITEFLKRHFYRQQNSPKDRIWSIAVSEFYLSEISYDSLTPEQKPPVTPDSFHGLKYPSALRPKLGYNFAIRGSYVDSSMQITRADLLCIDPAKTEGRAIRHADRFDKGTILWETT